MKHSYVAPISKPGLTSPTQELREHLSGALRLLEEQEAANQPKSESDRRYSPTERQVRALMKARRLRERIFGAELFADPAWDMMLELYATAKAQQRISISSLCFASAVPATTALRWINALERRSLIRRRDDPMDGRRVYVDLTEQAESLLETYFAKLPEEMRFNAQPQEMPQTP